MDKKKKVNRFSMDMINMQELIDGSDRIFCNDELLMVMNGSPHDVNFLREGEIYHIVEPRIVIILDGSGDISINLEDYHIKQGTVIMAGSDMILEIKSVTSDAKVVGIVFREGIYMSEDAVINVSSIELQRLLKMVYLSWDMANITPYRRDVVTHILKAVVADLQCIKASYEIAHPDNNLSRWQIQFQKFKSLVHQHCSKERSIPFYAGKMGIASHHLSAVIKKASGKSVMYWINRAVILESKMLLKTSNLLVYEVADYLNFPSDSAFSRFFKRETGLTPRQYMEQ